MDLRPAEVTSILEKEIEEFSQDSGMQSVGTVLSVGDGVARVYGLDDCVMNELLEFEGGVRGVALNLEEDNVGCVLLGSATEVKEGQQVKGTGRIISVPTGDKLLGRVVNALGDPVDGKGPLGTSDADLRPIEQDAPSVVERQPVDQPLQTGIKAIDAMIPIGRGQRELIIGDRQTGKTALARGHDPIAGTTAAVTRQPRAGHLHLRGHRPEAVHGGRRRATPRVRRRHGLHDRRRASAIDEASMQYLAPYAGCAMGERFRDEGRHVVIFYDDLYKQALAYRQVMLLLRRPPGREAFPGDVFNLHSRLLERAAKLADNAPEINPRFSAGGGTLTALPVVETQEGDVSAYIPTNVISITDGQIFLEGNLFNAGIRPAVNAGISVSRVGGAAQIPPMKKTAGSLRLDLAQFRELQAFAQFGSDLDKATQAKLTRGERLVEVLKQGQYRPVEVANQVMIIYAGTSGALDGIPANKVGEFEAQYLDYVNDTHPEVAQQIRDAKKDIPAEVKSILDEAAKTVAAQIA